MAQTKITSVQLTDSGVTPGPYTNADITVDSSGRITTAANGGSSATPGGASGDIQFNEAGSFGGNSIFTFDPITGNLDFNPGIIGTTSGDVSFKTGDSTGTGNVPGYVILQPGLSTDQSESDGSVEIRVGQATGFGGYFNISTGTVERLKIGSQGSWKVNGNNGTVGQVLSSGGPGNPPTWETSGSGGGTVIQTFVERYLAVSVNGLDYYATDGDEAYTVSLPEINYNTTTKEYEVINGGTFTVEVSGFISIVGFPNANWMNGLTTFGLEIQTDGSGYEWSDFTRPVHSTFGSAAVGADSFTETPQYAITRIAFTEKFIWQTPGSESFYFRAWCLNVDLAETDSVNLEITTQITKVSNDTGA
jgi:hypothetical protein